MKVTDLTRRRAEGMERVVVLETEIRVVGGKIRHNSRYTVFRGQGVGVGGYFLDPIRLSSTEGDSDRTL